MLKGMDVTGGDELVAATEGRAERVANARPVLDDIADDFHRIEAHRFDSGGEGSWPPLSPATVAAKIRAGLDPRILHATGALRASLTGEGGSGAFREVTSDEVTVGTTLRHAIYHGRRRPPIGIREADRRRWAQMVGSFIATGVSGGAGL